MASQESTRPLTRDERAFLDKALLAADAAEVLKNPLVAPEGAAQKAANYAASLLSERRRLLSQGVSR